MRRESLPSQGARLARRCPGRTREQTAFRLLGSEEGSGSRGKPRERSEQCTRERAERAMHEGASGGVLSSASDDDGDRFQARCASSPKKMGNSDPG